MNNARRKRLAKISEQLESLKAELEEVKDQEQEAFDNMPGSFQDGEKGERMQEIIYTLEGVVGDMENAIENINEAQE